MFSQFAIFLLSATALAPVTLLWALRLWDSNRDFAWSLLAITGLLCILAGMFIWLIPRQVEPGQLNIAKTKSVDRDVLSMLLAYMLPLMSKSDKPIDMKVFAATVIVITVVVYQSQLLHVNPVIGLFGFHFFEVTSEAGHTHIVMTRRRSLPADQISAFKLSEVLWYDNKAI